MKYARLAWAAAMAVAASATYSQAYPTKPITLVIGFPPGGGADGVARPVAEALSKQLGQPVVLDYRPGAGTTIASSQVASAPADGYTLYMTSGTHYGADKILYRNRVKYDGNSFTPIARWTRTPLVLAVNTHDGITSTRQLIERAKSKPDGLTYASSGYGVPPHLAAVLFEKAAGVKMVHVPFKGGAPAVTSLASGDVNLTFGTPPSILPIAQTGKIKVIAVTSAERSPMFPELPTVAEAGVKEFDYTFWFGLFGPAGLPKEVVNKLFEASSKALADPDLKARLEKTGNQVATTKSNAEFISWAQVEGQRLKELMERSGAVVE